MSNYESFYRTVALGSQSRTLPANEYNGMRLLLDFSGKPCVFVPLRSMQYLAVIDAEEVIFVDSFNRLDIEFAWQQFKPQLRQSLNEPVNYEWVYYQEKALTTMQRAQGEFFRAVKSLLQRTQAHHQHPSATILPFKPRQPLV